MGDIMYIINKIRKMNITIRFSLILLLVILCSTQIIGSVMLLNSSWKSFKSVKTMSSINMITDSFIRFANHITFEKSIMENVLKSNQPIKAADEEYINKYRVISDLHYQVAINEAKENYNGYISEIELNYEKIKDLRNRADKIMKDNQTKDNEIFASEWSIETTNIISLVQDLLLKIGYADEQNIETFLRYHAFKIYVFNLKNNLGSETSAFSIALLSSAPLSDENVKDIMLLRGKVDSIWDEMMQEAKFIDSKDLLYELNEGKRLYFDTLRPIQDDIIESLKYRINREDYTEYFFKLKDLLEVLLDISYKESEAFVEEKFKQASVQFIIATVILLVSLALIVLAPLLITTKIIKPMKSLVGVLDNLRKGNFNNKILWTDRKDEIGFFARGVQMLQKNIEEREKLQNILKENERKLLMMNMVIEQSPISIIITDKQANIIYTNPQISKVTGFSSEELKNANMTILKSNHTPQEVYEDMWNTVYSGNIWKGEILNKKKEGTLFWEEISVFPVLDSEGNILNFVTIRMDITEKKRIHQILQHMSYTDGLTGIPNRRSLDEKLLSAWEESADKKEPLSILMIDIDFFKNYNDGLGHQQGDECLKIIAEVLMKSVENTQYFAARYGGEEFIIVLPNTNIDEAVKLANLLVYKIEGLKLYHPNNEASDYVTISVGVASRIANAYVSPSIIIEEADNALYDAKHMGRNRVEF